MVKFKLLAQFPVDHLSYPFVSSFILSLGTPEGGARGVMVIVVGNGHGDTSSNHGRDSISHSTNTLGKGMNPIILLPAMVK